MTREVLPRLTGGLFLSDGSFETTLVYLEGVELPHFAAFVLLTLRRALNPIPGAVEGALQGVRDRLDGLAPKLQSIARVGSAGLRWEK